MDYPLHLGVTEAGDGEDGRIKSAVGIGSLLEDGLGDTIRVSLTEEPEAEIPVAKALADRYTNSIAVKKIPAIDINPLKPFEYNKRQTKEILNLGNKNVPVVVADLSERQQIKSSALYPFGYNYSISLDKWNIADQACDYVYVGSNQLDFEIPGSLGIIVDYEYWDKNKQRHYPLFHLKSIAADKLSDSLNFIYLEIEDIFSDKFHSLKDLPNLVFIFESSAPMAEQRRMFIELMNRGISNPVIIKRSYKDLDSDKFQLYSSTDFGALFIDGLGDGIWIQAENCGGKQLITSTAFGILQATRTRISKTEYISCPSCGRTLFDLQETTAKIRAVTNHLKGVKIGIMGCIVNGPGEMADADYGYVGTGPGKVTLYKEKEVVQKNVPEKEAVDALISLIKKHGDWVETPLDH